MTINPPYLHIILDSREQALSYARRFYLRLGKIQLGEVIHIRQTAFAEHFKLMLQKTSLKDTLLISLHFITQDQLDQTTSYIEKFKKILPRVTIASFACFTHIKEWCVEYGMNFEANTYKRRSLSPQTEDKIKHYLCNEVSLIKDCDRENLERIWIQYRLMISIISRSHILGNVARLLIEGQPDENSSLQEEFRRALRYYKLGELDMAGGTYSCEKDSLNAIDQLRNRINLIAATDYNVLIQGESGSGKETVAWAIHELSARRNNPFLTINCAGLSDELLESEMYGYVKGSHNQAVGDHSGLLAAANGGTIFLDELPEMGPRIQAKFLRMLESGEYRPIGGMENIYSDVRIIAAGQTTLLSDPFRVRRDLMSRISQLCIEILPLRDLEKSNPGTLCKIIHVLLERYTWTTVFRNGMGYELSPKDIQGYQEALEKDPEKILKLSRGDWKESNIRQLNNFLRHWLVFGDDEFQNFPALNGNHENSSVSAETPGIHKTIDITDEQLKQYLCNVKSRDELAALFATNPIHDLKKAYMRHIFHVYEKIVEIENKQKGTDTRPTQKELASLIGVTEYTLSRYRN
jgi:DNA-binding NtrC family response regulator